MTSLAEIRKIYSKAALRIKVAEDASDRSRQEKDDKKRLRKTREIINSIEGQMLSAAEEGKSGVAILAMSTDVQGLNPEDRKYVENWDEKIFNAVFDYCDKQGWKPKKNNSEYYGDSGIFIDSIHINWGGEDSS